MAGRTRKWKPITLDGEKAAKKTMDFVAKCEDPEYVAKCLRQYQMWRRGEGEYAFDEDPANGSEIPLDPKALGIVEDQAIKMLKEMANAGND